MGQTLYEEDWSLQEKVDAQLELLGVSIAAHPLELIADKLTAQARFPLWMQWRE